MSTPKRAPSPSAAGSRCAPKECSACRLAGRVMTDTDWFTAAAGELPTEAEEIWRYSRISELDLGAYAPATAATVDGAGAGAGVPAGVESLLAAIGPRSALAVTRNGHLVVSEGDAVSRAETLGQVAHNPDAFATLNTAFVADPIFIDVPNGKAVREPIVVVHWLDSDGVAVFPRVVVHVGEAA